MLTLYVVSYSVFLFNHFFLFPRFGGEGRDDEVHELLCMYSMFILSLETSHCSCQIGYFYDESLGCFTKCNCEKSVFGRIVVSSRYPDSYLYIRLDSVIILTCLFIGGCELR